MIERIHRGSSSTSSTACSREETERTALFARACLAAGRCSSVRLSATVTVVVTVDGDQVDCGQPSEWQPGIAQRIMRKELFVKEVPRPFAKQPAALTTRVRARSMSIADRMPMQPQTTAAILAADVTLPFHGDEPMDIIAGKFKMQGAPPYQEDECVAFVDCKSVVDAASLPALGQMRWSYFGVYDGHGGGECSKYCTEKLHAQIFAQKEFASDPAQAVKEAYLRLDRQFLRKSKKRDLMSGAAVVTALIAGRSVYVAWAGDSKAILCRNGKAVELTLDHHASREDERQRIEAAGGFVSQGRVGGFVQVSRALGDYESAHDAKIHGMTAEPDMHVERLTDDDEFLILGTDGLFEEDCFTPASAVSYVYQRLQMNDNDATVAAEQLVVEAVENRMSQDNCAAIVVTFKKLPPPPPRPRLMFGRGKPSNAGQLASVTLKLVQQAEVSTPTASDGAGFLAADDGNANGAGGMGGRSLHAGAGEGGDTCGVSGSGKG